jgi:dTMP kinase
LSVEVPAVSARTEALLMAADRAEHVARVVEPALEAGEWVVTDRFSGSTLAYQGWGRGLDVAELTSLVDWACNGVRADLSVLVDLPVEMAARRLGSGRADRLESLGHDFASRVREGFLSQAAADPRHWVVVDGSGPIAAVAAQILETVTERLGARVGEQ